MNPTAILACARDPRDLACIAFAGVMSMAPTRQAPYGVPIARLNRSDFATLLERYFPSLDPRPWLAHTSEGDLSEGARFDEFADLANLLLDHASFDTEECRWVALAIATASMGENHLWQDMGLPDRRTLSQLIEQNFTSLFVRNVGDMKWKKFFYRQLCERAEVLICKSPSCGICVDFDKCFGAEELAAPGTSPSR
jgi:nitrogen fixation protein NifQ